MSDLPPLPSYTLSPVQPLISFIPDFYLSLMLPIAAYWIVSMFFHIIDVYDVWPQYRLHTPAEILKRNHVSRYEVARDVVIQQIIQTVVGIILGITEPEEVTGREEYDIAVWATRLRIAQRVLPQLLGLLGLNAAAISKNMAGSHPMLAGALAGGKYPSLALGMDALGGSPVPTFASWEVFAAKALYWYIVPALQFWLSILIVDTWQYFLHRAMHINKWLYSKSSSASPCFPCWRNKLHSIRVIIASMSHTLTERFTTTPSKASYLTHSGLALHTKLLGWRLAKEWFSLQPPPSKRSMTTAVTHYLGTPCNTSQATMQDTTTSTTKAGASRPTSRNHSSLSGIDSWVRCGLAIQNSVTRETEKQHNSRSMQTRWSCDFSRRGVNEDTQLIVQHERHARSSTHSWDEAFGWGLDGYESWWAFRYELCTLLELESLGERQGCGIS